MNWIEVIQIRLAGKDLATLEPQLNKLMQEVNVATDNQLMVYKQLDLNTDIRIHLLHNSKKIENGGSSLGLRLVSSLKEYGFVNHSVWQEI